MAHFSGEFWVHAPPAKFLRLKFSEMQSGVFQTLKFRKCRGFHIELVMLKYLRKKFPDKRGGGGPLGPPLNPPLNLISFVSIGVSQGNGLKIDGDLISHVQITRFGVKALLVLHWSLYNNKHDFLNDSIFFLFWQDFVCFMRFMVF